MASLLLAGAALLVLPALPHDEPAVENGIKTLKTIDKLDRVETAMRIFASMHGRRPCPADGAHGVGTSQFGIEAANPGACTGGTPSAPLGPDAGTGQVVGGTIPTRTLGLPDDYAFDEWGHRFTYVVDKRATLASSCLALMHSPANDGHGAIQVQFKDDRGKVLSTDQVMYAYISHGPDGQGAFPREGSSVAGRINAHAADPDRLTNAGVDAQFRYSPSTFTQVKVQKGLPSGFNDLVHYHHSSMNRCCLGTACARPTHALPPPATP